MKRYISYIVILSLLLLPACLSSEYNTLRGNDDINGSITKDNAIAARDDNISGRDAPVSDSTLSGKDDTTEDISAINSSDMKDIPADDSKVKEDDGPAEDRLDEPAAVITIKDDGFYPQKTDISLGEDILFMNNRTKDSRSYHSMMIGNGACRNMRSGEFMKDESFRYTADHKGFCTYVDGIRSNQVGYINIR